MKYGRGSVRSPEDNKHNFIATFAHRRLAKRVDSEIQMRIGGYIFCSFKLLCVETRALIVAFAIVSIEGS